MNEIDINEIFQKLRTKSDIKNFFLEQGKYNFILYNFNKKFIALYFPDGHQFGKSFVLNVLNGRKKLLPLGCYGGLTFLITVKIRNLSKSIFLRNLKMTKIYYVIYQIPQI